ncbi:MAG: M23 family metallopeptidase [Blastomonas sp.]
MVARLFACLASVSAFLLAAASPALANDESATDFSAAAEMVTGENGEALGTANPEFRQLFDGWKAMDSRSVGKVAIPSRQPVDSYRLTSQYGFREDPFKGRRARHKGLDMAGPIGTPIYATADGIVGRAQWVNGYGKYVEINHGGTIQTRYGHMSQILVEPNERVTRGQMIGLMGSTGRSTGSHLHYEVRIAGESVNPIPFLKSDGYLLSMQERNEAQGGPED